MFWGHSDLWVIGIIEPYRSFKIIRNNRDEYDFHFVFQNVWRYDYFFNPTLNKIMLKNLIGNYLRILERISQLSTKIAVMLHKLCINEWLKGVSWMTRSINGFMENPTITSWILNISKIKLNRIFAENLVKTWEMETQHT